MQIVFVNYGPYCLASGVHIHFIANEMVALGHDCTVVLPEMRGNEDQYGPRRYATVDCEDFARRLGNGAYSAQTVFHAWTPREDVRQITEQATAFLGARYYVHLEDNERRILECKYHKPFAELERDAHEGRFVLEHISDSHPLLHQQFLAGARGITILMDTLEKFVPAGLPSLLFWPACEKEFFTLGLRPNIALRRQLGIPDECTVLVYPGNVHQAVAHTVAPLYRALPLIAAAGHPVRLVRCSGGDQFKADDSIVGLLEQYVLEFPTADPRDLPKFLRASDILVQPGAPNAFDAYRFPSKLPLFLASGRPVILARTNIGRFLTDGTNCRILEENTPEAIAKHVVELIEQPELASKIGQGGREFAREHFNWQKTALKLIDFYEGTN